MCGLRLAEVALLERDGNVLQMLAHVPDAHLVGRIVGGDIDGACSKIAHNVALLLPHVRAGRKVIVAGPSCGMMMKKEWAEYLPSPEVREVAAATVDVMEFLVTLGREKQLNRTFPQALGKVAYHAACHLRAQKIGFPGMRVLNVVPGTEVRMVEECSAVDGTWGMKARHYETGRRYAQKLVQGVQSSPPDLVLSDCSLASLRITHESGRQTIHPIEAVAVAYGLVAPPGGGFRCCRRRSRSRRWSSGGRTGPPRSTPPAEVCLARLGGWVGSDP